MSPSISDLGIDKLSRQDRLRLVDEILETLGSRDGLGQEFLDDARAVFTRIGDLPFLYAADRRGARLAPSAASPTSCSTPSPRTRSTCSR
jgi:hypothetical protein